MKSRKCGYLCALALLVAPAASYAATVTLGTQHFTDGTLLDGRLLDLNDFKAAVAGNPAPFNSFIGSDVDGPNFDATFTFNFAPATITDASLTIGIYDDDAQATGNQVSLFTLDGIDSGLTTLMSSAAQSHGGAQTSYDVLTVKLPASVLSQLNDGSGSFHLTLQGPNFVGSLPYNGAGIDFATLNYSTSAIPLPAALPVGLALMTGLGFIRMSRRART